MRSALSGKRLCFPACMVPDSTVYELKTLDDYLLGMCNQETILIHGTWSDGDRWNGRLEAIREAFSHDAPDCTLRYAENRVKKFEWSGKLSHHARETAAKELSDYVCDLYVNEPQTKITLVGHSHGGNVALLTLKYLQPHWIDTIVTLGCPLMGFYSQAYLNARPSRWIAVYGEIDWVQWLASFFRPLSRRRADPNADLNLVISNTAHRALIDNPITWETLSGVLPNAKNFD